MLLYGVLALMSVEKTMHDIAVACAVPTSRTKYGKPIAEINKQRGYRSRRRTTPEQATSTVEAFIQCLPGGVTAQGTFVPKDLGILTSVFYYPSLKLKLRKYAHLHLHCILAAVASVICGNMDPCAFFSHQKQQQQASSSLL